MIRVDARQHVLEAKEGVSDTSGHGSCQHSDVRYGNVTSYLMTHAAMPVLITRPYTVTPAHDVALIANHHFSRMPAVGPA